MPSMAFPKVASQSYSNEPTKETPTLMTLHFTIMKWTNANVILGMDIFGAEILLLWHGFVK